MLDQKSDEEVSEAVRKSIKREGKFDAIRKKAMANMNAEGFLEELKNEMKVGVEELMKTFPPTWSKDDIKQKIRDHISETYNERIEQKIFSEVRIDWIENELSTDVVRKIRATYGLPEVIEPKIEIDDVNGTNQSDSTLKGDAEEEDNNTSQVADMIKPEEGDIDIEVV